MTYYIDFCMYVSNFINAFLLLEKYPTKRDVCAYTHVVFKYGLVMDRAQKYNSIKMWFM